MDAYFKAVGESELIKYLHVYKIHVGRKGSTMFLSEYFGFRGYYPNTLELDMETPLYQPGDKKGKMLQKSKRLYLVKLVLNDNC